MPKQASPTPVHLHCCRQQMNHLGTQAHRECLTVEDLKFSSTVLATMRLCRGFWKKNLRASYMMKCSSKLIIYVVSTGLLIFFNIFLERYEQEMVLCLKTHGQRGSTVSEDEHYRLLHLMLNKYICKFMTYLLENTPTSKSVLFCPPADLSRSDLN